MTNIPGLGPGATFDPARLISLSEAALSLRGKGGKPPHRKTVWLWARKGCRLPSGKRLKLRSVPWGKERLTLPEWVVEFQAKRAEAGLRESIP